MKRLVTRLNATNEFNFLFNKFSVLFSIYKKIEFTSRRRHVFGKFNEWLFALRPANCLRFKTSIITVCSFNILSLELKHKKISKHGFSKSTIDVFLQVFQYIIDTVEKFYFGI